MISRVSFLLLVAGLFACSLGCGGSSSKVYPVEGKVVFKGKAGGSMRPLMGAKVRLQSTTDPKLMPVGSIEEDGSFSLGTPQEEGSLPGVPAGAYKVRIETRTEDDDGTDVRSTLLPKYLDFDRWNHTITVPVSGEVVLEVERAKR